MITLDFENLNNMYMFGRIIVSSDTSELDNWDEFVESNGPIYYLVKYMNGNEAVKITEKFQRAVYVARDEIVEIIKNWFQNLGFEYPHMNDKVFSNRKSTLNCLENPYNVLLLLEKISDLLGNSVLKELSLNVLLFQSVEKALDLLISDFMSGYKLDKQSKK